MNSKNKTGKYWKMIGESEKKKQKKLGDFSKSAGNINEWRIPEKR